MQRPCGVPCFAAENPSTMIARIRRPNTSALVIGVYLLIIAFAFFCSLDLI